MRSAILAALTALALAGCGAPSVWAPDEAVSQAHYRHDGPPEITLFTVINNRSGEGAHSALMINGSERIMFDPAGSWYHGWSPERNDVHYGITPLIEKRYIDYHTRVTYRTVIQRIRVTPEVADRAIALAEGAGPVPKAMCANSTSAILRQLPGFESIPQSYFPKKVSEAFGALPGATFEVVYDDDDDDNSALLAAQNSEAAN